MSGEIYVGAPSFAATPPAILSTGGSFATGIETITADTTLDATHHTVEVDASGGDVTVTLPAASGCQGREYTIIAADVTNTVTISGTVSGDTNPTIPFQWDAPKIKSNGTAWRYV